MAKKRSDNPPLSVTQLDIARACGLNQATVSRVLTGSPQITEETKRQVLDTARQLGYNPALHDAARRLVLKRQGRTLLNHTLGVGITEQQLQYRYFNLIMQGIWRAAQEGGYSIVILNLPGTGAPGEAIPSPIYRGEVDGMIVIDVSQQVARVVDDLMHKHPAGQDYPCLILLQTSTPYSCPILTADYRQGGYLTMQHLLEMGHRHVLHFIYLPLNDSSICRRLQGAQQALREWGLDPDCHLTTRLPAPKWNSPGMLMALAGWDQEHEFDQSNFFAPPARELVDFIRRHPQITAVVAINDAQAILLTYTLRAAGIRVPEEISVIGFDDTDPLLDEMGCNTLTTVRLPLMEAGRFAAHWMIERIERQEAATPLPSLPVELIVRATTARCPR